MKTTPAIDDIWERVRDVNAHYAISEAELRFILEYAFQLPGDRPLILELGVCHGRTLAALGMVPAVQVSGIDNFSLEGSFHEVRQTLAAVGSDAWVIEGNTHNVHWDSPIDLLVVDAGHDEANVKPDIERFVSLVKPGGYVFFDDYPDTIDKANPHWAIKYYADLACNHWHDLGQVEGMKGWQRP